MSSLAKSPYIMLPLILALGACGGESGDGTGGDTAQGVSVGPQGATVTADGVTAKIPAGALKQEVEVAVKPLTNAQVAALPEPTLPELTEGLTLSSNVVAFTPHGTKFAKPVSISLPYDGAADYLLRLDDPKDTTWEAVDYVDFADGIARFDVDGFSLYAVAGLVVDSVPQEPDTNPIQPDPTAGLEGEHVVDVYDSGSRSAYMQVIFDGKRIFWTRDADAKLAIFSADVSGSLPATEELVFEAPWAPASGWSNPPLLATSEHLVFPVIGVIDVGGGLKDANGWATLRKDGSDLKLDALDNWWFVARGPDVIKASFDLMVTSVSPATGIATPFADFLVQPASRCVYDAVVDEMGCLNGGIVAYRFSDSMTTSISQSPSIHSSELGSTQLTFNSAHWFAPVSLPSGAGIGAFARDGSGVTYHEDLDALGAFVADDSFIFACIAGVLTRVPLAGGERTVLSEDCGEAAGISILGADATYLYYVHLSKLAQGYPQVQVFQKNPLQIYRVAKDAQRN